MTPCDESAAPHIHHLHTIAGGGDDSVNNCVIECATCHAGNEYEVTTEAVTCPACDLPMTAGNAGCLPCFENGAGNRHRRLKHNGPGACHDCGAAAGAYHHVPCDLEECPRCGVQMVRAWEHEACDWQYVVEKPPAKGRGR